MGFSFCLARITGAIMETNKGGELVMKKFWRGLYIATIYIIGTPLVLVYLAVMIPAYSIWMKKECGEWDTGEMIRAMWEGFKEGHDMLMFWVRHGELDMFSYWEMKAKGSK